MSSQSESDCPVCFKKFPQDSIESHVNKCLFLSSSESQDEDRKPSSSFKRPFSIFEKSPSTSKKARISTAGSSKKSPELDETDVIDLSEEEDSKQEVEDAPPKPSSSKKPKDSVKSSKPLAEVVRPEVLDDYIGQEHVMSKNAVLRTVLEKNEIPSMILWGPPGCGKTTLAHIVANQCKQSQNIRFIKLSATMSGINEVKKVVENAKTDQKYRRKTILFMDEIHRFNKLQQDTFLPHVESGVITLIGATTENPSFSLNSALLSRCRVIILEKLATEDIVKILERGIREYDGICLEKIEGTDRMDFDAKLAIDRESLVWLAQMCDGDARIALNSLQLAIQTLTANDDCGSENGNDGLKIITLDAIREGIKKSHLLYDRKGDQHYDIISALHKSIRASDDNAALYYCVRMMAGGEDPRYICRRMVRAASEDIGLADPNAVTIALSALQAVQLIGMPEADCIVAQCAVYLARAPKSQEVYRAMMKCRSEDITNWKGPLPSVPLHLRNAPTKLMREMGCAKGYNMRHKDDSGLQYMPEGMEDRDYFQ
ncbi:ATPase WRNIP1-like [Lutzomyia longipalpis]|uniref:ATPase WRNIP1-like n=1 Tax=Lutzomyia longipalpis TaxID=7200 RepID=UPI002483CDAD|nr:ATPase WRNIP1-like [Lutzomyia longipalpis]